MLFASEYRLRIKCDGNFSNTDGILKKLFFQKSVIMYWENGEMSFWMLTDIWNDGVKSIKN